MKAPWTDLYDSVKDRRYGTLYIGATMIVAGVCVIAQASRELFEEYGHEIANWAIAIAVVWFLIAVFRFTRDLLANRSAKPGGSNAAQLSSDEVSKARSKLLKNRGR